MKTLSSICVYCGSSAGASTEFAVAAEALADALVAQRIRLVYGGANIGIMGQVANRVLQLGGEVIGVIPKALAHKEVAHHGLTELEITESMHQRKMRMAQLADGFIALPGGIGTLEELFEIWTWAQLGLHDKPVGLLNVDGFYDGLLQFLDQVRDQQLMRSQHRDLLMVETHAEPLLARFRTYQAPPVPHWLNLEQS